MSAPRILFIDAYDSFSNNIISLLREQIDARVESIRIDDARFVLNDDALYHYLSGFDAVVAGPGPGHPGKPQDIGLIARLWMLPEEHTLPVLGICLGFQSLCLATGASVERLREPRHGLVTRVRHCGSDVYGATGEILATQYHSLQVRINEKAVKGSELWTPSKRCPDLLPLAWDLSDELNGPILMAAKHANKPFWGVQYHPESICTNAKGQKMIRNWWKSVCEWQGLKVEDPYNDPAQDERQDRVDSGRTSEDCQERKVHWQSLPLSKDVDVTHVVDLLRSECGGNEPLLLESGTREGKPVNAETGRFSIVGVPGATSTQIRYCTSGQCLTVGAGDRTLLECNATISDVFDYLEHFVAERKAVSGPEEVPFWGGLVGYISYEAGLETIDVEPSVGSDDQSDVCFVYVERSVVVDHVRGELHALSLDDEGWVDRTIATFRRWGTPRKGMVRTPVVPARVIDGPTREEYCANVLECQTQLRAGESYELCLTDTTRIQAAEDSWSLYRRLRHLNPAPFGAHIALPATPSTDSLSIASSSPERFLSWTREGECQFRPIKGTVSKSGGTTREVAEKILRSPKEQAENLMIVDLIRHDLSGVEGVTNVHVPTLMSIEEYATVYQLVSVITGTTDPTTNPIRVLAASLPPGSMTGAPKKRSCELLRQIEGAGHKRGIYSGVIGYLDVGGGGDFSVAIRTAWKWGSEGCWSVGAGGAVTVLSRAEEEWEEMVGKRESLLRAFGTGG